MSGFARGSLFEGAGAASAVAEGVLPSSPSQSSPVGFARFPLLSLTRHLPPARGKSFLKVGALGSPRGLHLFAKASPFGRGGCERSEQTERARLLPLCEMPFPSPLLQFVQLRQLFVKKFHLRGGENRRREGGESLLNRKNFLSEIRKKALAN